MIDWKYNNTLISEGLTEENSKSVSRFEKEVERG